tara:strand:- start:41 stop:274 length:234 start_codon:yes stop_codon:yes gene_type:complete
MRIGYKKFKEIKKWYGSSNFEIGYDRDGLTLRFGYWQKVDFEGLQQILPDYFEITENLVDEDDDCGPLYNYIIKRAY